MPKPRVKISPYKTVWRGEIFDVQQARALFPSGKTKMFERVIRPGSVMILAIDEKKRLWLTREYRHKSRGYVWRVPGGRIDKGETPCQAAARELREEAGVKAGKLKLFHTARGAQTLEWRRYTYIATGLNPAKLMGDEDEDITVVPTPITKVFKMALTGEIEHELLTCMFLKLYRERKKWIK